jgi:hypothetical protein
MAAHGMASQAKSGTLQSPSQLPPKGDVTRKDGNQIVETPVEARGGFPGRPVFVVLAVSLVLAIAAMALSYAGYLAAT